jgi:hypothetical protein
MSRRASVISATVNPRFIANLASIFFTSGHVEITIRTAHIMDNKKGLRTQKLATMRAPMESTARVVGNIIGNRKLGTHLGILLLET